MSSALVSRTGEPKELNQPQTVAQRSLSCTAALWAKCPHWRDSVVG